MIDIYVLENCKYISTYMSRTSRTHRRAEDSVPWPGDRLVSRLLRKFAPLVFTFQDGFDTSERSFTVHYHFMAIIYLPVFPRERL